MANAFGVRFVSVRVHFLVCGLLSSAGCHRYQPKQLLLRSRQDSVSLYQTVLNDTGLQTIIRADFGDEPLQLVRRQDISPQDQLSFMGNLVPIVSPDSMARAMNITRRNDTGGVVLVSAGKPIAVLTMPRRTSSDTATVSMWFDVNGRTGFFKLVCSENKDFQVVSRAFGKK